MSLLSLVDAHRDLQANLEWRVKLRQAAKSDAKLRAAWMQACAEDPIFFFNTMFWLFEPRTRYDSNGVVLPKIIPFITWPHQDEAIKEIHKHLGSRDIGLEKSRGEGASWIGVGLGVHTWLFDEMAAVGFVSRTMDAADSPDDPDSLMWKVVWELKMLPRWVVGSEGVDWRRDRARHNLLRVATGSTITAYAAVGDVASGGRKKWFLMDELAKWGRGPDEQAMASTQHVTDSRLVVSTPKGAEGAYYELMHEPSNLIKLVLAWQDNPTKNRGMYRMQDGVPVAVDPVNNPLPAHYDPPSQEVLDMFSRLRKKGFRIEGVVRSPWYDNECDRPRATPQSIAQELDRDYGGSSYRIFGHEVMDKAQETIREPYRCGDMTVAAGESDNYQFETLANGPIKLWVTLDERGRPPIGSYAFGADVSSGLGGSHTSNSAIIGIDVRTGEQVLEYAINSEHPHQFTDKCLAICKWFHNAYFAWEHQGPGYFTTARVKTSGYPNVYLRKEFSRRNRKRSGSLGWWMTPESKEKLFMDAAPSIRNGELVIRSRSLHHEMGQYVRMAGKIINVNVQNAPDDSAGAAHGDRVIAFLIAYQAMLDRPLEKTKPTIAGLEEGEPPPGTIAHRLWERSRERKKKDLWDRRTLHDLAMGRG